MPPLCTEVFSREIPLQEKAKIEGHVGMKNVEQYAARRIKSRWN
jgi:hypothetical protein